MKIRFFLMSYLFICAYMQVSHAAIVHNNIVVIIPSYNNINFYKKNLDSLVGQNYDNWVAYYINDCSTDGTGGAVQAYITEHALQGKIIYSENQRRCGALENFYRTIHQCDDKAVIVTLDGDDWLYDSTVLSKVNRMYQNSHVWLTYGQYQLSGLNRLGAASKEIPQEVIRNNSFRDAPFYSSHLRTFYAWLFKKIEKEDLQYNGEFYQKTWDLAMMFPMLEMAGDRIRLSPDVLYVYNIHNPITDARVDKQEVFKLDKIIRKQKKYKRLHKGL